MKGERIKKIRAEKGMTLKDLAEITGFTPSYISQIEREIRQPSLETLRKIASSLNVPLLAFMVDFDDSQVIREKERKKVFIPQVQTEYEFITPTLSDENIKPNMVGLYVEIDPGKAVSEKLISHSGQESIFVLEGEVEVQLYDQSFKIKKGDSFYLRENVPHNIQNKGQKKAITIHYFSPPIY